MKFSKLTRLAAGTVSILCAVCIFCMSGCSVRFGTAPKDSDIVAKPSTGSSPELEITFGDFNKQYLYYLKVNGIDDDTTAENSENCKARRADIIENMTLNRIYLQKAKELGLDTLSAEDMALVDEEYENQINSLIEYYGKKALGVESTDSGSSSSDSDSSSGSDNSPSSEEITSKGSEELDRLLADCGLTRSDLHRWLEEYLISANVLDELLKSVTRETAENEFNEMVKEIEDLYNSENKLVYYQNGYYNSWIPEGSRMIKHVLLGFDEETQTQIKNLREEGKDDEANTLRSEKAEGFADKIAEVEEKLDANEDFNTILLNYSADAAGSSAYPNGYLVTPGDMRYVAEFTEAAFVPEKIGGRTLCTSDYGVHIMIYASDAKVDENYVEAVVDNILGQLRSEEADKLIEQWKTEYNYQIDYEKLRIDPASL